METLSEYYPSGKTGELIVAKPTQRRLLIPLAAVLLLLVGGFVATLLHMQQESLNQTSREKLAAVLYGLKEHLAEQTDALEAVEDVLLHESGLIDALEAQDQSRLLADYEPIFKQLRAEHGITHFYFHRPDRVNLLRLHQPEKHGDLTDRFTAVEAERTGQTVSGIELGSMGTLTLRVVRPVFDGDTLIGYLELGKEIKSVLEDLSKELGLEFAVGIHKNALKRETWEVGMKMLGREPDWNRFSEDVLIYSSMPRFSAEAERFVGKAGHAHRDVTATAAFDDKTWRIMVAPLTDVSGTEVGDLIVFYDTSEAVAQFKRLLAVVLGGAFVLLSALLGFLYVLLRRTDRGISLQQAELAESEEKFRAIFDQAFQFIGLLTRDGILLKANKTALGFAGIKESDVVGKRFWETPWWSHSKELRDLLRDAISRAAAGELVRFETFHPGLDGSLHYLDASIKPVSDEGGNVILLIPEGRDITERKRAEEERTILLHDMEERVKELTCMYGMANSIRQRNTLEEIFLDVARLIPPGWHYPEITRGRVSFEGREYVVEPFEETEWKQTSDIIIGGRRCGTVEVYYLEECPELDEGPFMKEERHLIDALSQALSEAIERKRAEQEIQNFATELRQSHAKLEERVKELTCMYGMADSIRRRNTLEEIFLDVAALIPPGWHYPEITRGRVSFEGREYVVEPFEETEWKQTSDIIVGGKRCGTVEVYYLEECPELDEGPFMKEERHLIDALSQALGEAIELKLAEQEIRNYAAKLRQSHAKLEERVKKRTAQLEEANQRLRAEMAEREQLESALRVSEERFRHVFAESPLGMVIIDTEGKCLQVNQEICRMLDREPSRIVGESMADLGFSLFSQYTSDELRRVTAGEIPSFTWESEFARGNGETAWAHVTATAVHDQNDKLLCGLGMVQDITKRRTAELALRRSEELFRLAFEEGPLGIWIIDEDGKCYQVNRAFSQMLGYLPSELHGKTLLELTHPHDRATQADHLHQLLRGSCRRYSLEKRYLDKDGQPIWTHLTATAVYDHDGVWLYGLGMVEDINQRKEAEEALRRAERLASIGTLSAGIAHEINNPLSAIVLSADAALLAGEQPHGAEIVDASLRNIQAGALRCGRIVKNVLQFSRNEVSQKWLDDIGEVASRAKDMTKKMAADANVMVRLQIDPKLPRVKINPTEIEQVFINLITNAIHASAAGDCVAVSVKRLGDEIIMSVEDTGVGMTEKQSKRIFDTFYTTKQSTGGTGLGLSISHGITQEHGGEIHFKTQPRGGTTMTITLPLTRD